MKPSVLVVDDSVDIQELVDIHLRQDDVDTVHASNAQQALAAAKRLSPSAIVLDLDLGAESGLDVCRALKRDPVTAAIPVIILTGTLDSPVRLKALAAGAIDYVAKPFSGADLRARVRTAIRLSRYRQLLLEHADLDADTELQSRRALDRRLPADAVLIAMAVPHAVIDRYGLPMFDTAMRALADVARSVGGPVEHRAGVTTALRCCASGVGAGVACSASSYYGRGMPKRRDVETTKVSIAITKDDLRTLRARAARLHGGNLSAAIADAAAKLRREEAAHRLLKRLEAAPLSGERAAELDAELDAPSTASALKKGRRRRAA